MRVLWILTISMSVIGAGCGSDEGDDEQLHSGGHTAGATLAPKSGNTTLAGSAKFSGEKGSVKVTVSVTGAPKGPQGLHIHETGDCSTADAMSAGNHWNPTMQMHAAPGAAAHLGDLGNIMVDDAGNGTVMLTHPAWEIGTGGANDVVGKAVVVHGSADDLMGQPAGNAGSRIGCGVIK